ncbi:MAG: class I SAM-dependent methyltransferase [Ignavibacteriaceae bacterium]|nr:class I SAM-dependent methyltransferase [Ignavibacteriaceae bacterium]
MPLLHKLKIIYLRETFSPSLLGVFLNPFYFVRRGLYRAINSNKKYITGKLLDFGCGSKPYKESFDVQEYVGVDIEQHGHPHQNENVDVFYDGETIPFKDNYFDSILSSEVFEHTFNLVHILTELNRVLKVGGYMLITIPFVFEEHEVPYDFARYTSYGISDLLKKANFRIVHIEQAGSYIETITQMMAVYIYGILPKNKYLNAILRLIFISPIIIIGLLLSKVLPRNEKLYNNNIIVAQK